MGYTFGIYELQFTLTPYMSDDFSRHHLPSAEKLLEVGLAMRVILPKDLLSTLKISEKNRRKAEIKVMDEISVSVIVTDKFLFLELLGLDGKIDQNIAIFVYDDQFREWCKKLFQYYWEKTKLFPL